MLFAADNIAFNFVLAETGSQFLTDVIDNFFAVTTGLFHRRLQGTVTHGIHGLKTKVFQLVLNVVDTQTMGNRRIDFQRLAGNTASLIRTQRP